MLQILKAGNEIFFNLVSGLFGTVAKVYDIMLKLVQENGMGEHVQLDDISTTIYVLAGVFMLFRVVISMIQMLINPDQVTDKNAGAGKLVVRVITCIIMLMVFVPNGLVFGENGILPRLESALLASDGLISRVGNIGGEIDIIETGSSSKKSSSKKDNSTGNDKTTSNSTKKADLTCYYINKSSHTKTVGGTNNGETLDITGIYKIEFYKGSGGKNTIAGTNYTYTDRSGQRIAGKDDNGTYDALPSPISQGNVFNTEDFTTCPKSFKQGQKYLISNSDTPTGDEVMTCDHNTSNNYGVAVTCENVGIMGGWSQLKDVSRYLNLYMKSRKDYTVNSDITFIRNNTGNKNKQRLKKTNDSSIVFAQKTASTLQECVEDKADECEEAQSEMFVTSDGDDAIVKLMDSGDLKVDLFLSVITGLGLVGYLLLLCVEVIIREFKLYLLKMIAPIAIISHVDPKDKIFGQWSKMLVSVYVDLFIKLISIGFAITLLNRVMDSFKAADGGLLVKFFYIVAILTFAKIVPTMISKIFGLDSMGGSFKDILGMGKAAAGFGVGAILGGTVGAMTGGVGGFFRGVARGAGAGSKGNLTGGAADVANYNRNLKFAKDAGSSPWGRVLARLGVNDYEEQKKAIDVEKANVANEKAEELEGIQREKSRNDNILSNISGFEKRVEDRFEKHKYDGKGIEEVEAYRVAEAEFQAAKQSGDADKIKIAGNNFSAAKARVLDAVKEYEIEHREDEKAGAYLLNLDPEVVKLGFKDGIDAQKKRVDASNILLGNQISELEDRYTQREQNLASRERALENSKTKADYDAAKNLNKK